MRALGLILVLAAVATEARAVPMCDDTERPAAPEVASALPAELEAVDVIVPCAMAENGDLGPVCIDATGYLVTVTGVVLCQMTLLEPVVEPLVFNDAHPHGASYGPSSAVFATLTLSPELRAPIGAARFVVTPPHDARPAAGVRGNPFAPG